MNKDARDDGETLDGADVTEPDEVAADDEHETKHRTSPKPRQRRVGKNPRPALRAVQQVRGNKLR